MFRKTIFAIILSGFVAMASGCAAEVGDEPKEEPNQEVKAEDPVESAGVGEPSTPTTAEKPASPEKLKVIDSSYVLNDGYIDYVVEIENPNSSYAVQYATLSVIGKRKDGTIAFKDDWTIGLIYPTSKTYWASNAGNGEVDESIDIEFSVKVEDDSWTSIDVTIPDDLYSFDNVSVRKGEYDDMQATGELTLNGRISDEALDSVDHPMIVCVFRDSDGDLITGMKGYVTGNLTPDEASVFDISALLPDFDYETVEFYANMWEWDDTLLLY